MASSEALKAFDPPGCWPLRSGGERVSLRWSRCAAIDEADVAGGLSEKREEDRRQGSSGFSPRSNL